MNREIKFRAKRLDRGMFAYGYFVKTPITTEFNCDGQFLDSGVGRFCIVQDNVAHEVDINTLGQFTGLLDCNKKEIYEGDIVEINGKRAEIAWGDAGFYFKDTRLEFDQYELADDKGYMKIIGNIYKNPELLNK